MKWKTILYFLIVILFLLIGIISGMLIGTYTVIDHVAQGLSGSTFIVQINETKLVDYSMQRLNDTILPQLNNSGRIK